MLQARHLEKIMNTLDAVLSEMDLAFLGTGTHNIGVEALRKNLDNDHMLVLDVRTPEEVAKVSFPFAKHIPLNELPARVGELPKDKLIVPFCSGVFRGAVAYTYLRAQGFTEVKALTANYEELVKVFKPGLLYQK